MKATKNAFRSKAALLLSVFPGIHDSRIPILGVWAWYDFQLLYSNCLIYSTPVWNLPIVANEQNSINLLVVVKETDCSLSS